MMFLPEFKEFYVPKTLTLTEARNSVRVDASQNTAIATAGEHLTTAHILKQASEAHKAAGNLDHARYLYNKGAAHQEHAQKYLNKHHPQLVTDTIERSRHVADSFIKHHESEGRKITDLHDIHHTPKNGDIEKATGVKTNQTDDPSDMVAHYKKGAKDDYHGLSYKNNNSNTLGTPGTKATDETLGTKHQELYNEFQNKMKKKHGKDYSSQEFRKKLASSDEGAKKESKDFVQSAAKHSHDTFTKANTDKQREHLKKIFKMNPKVPYVLAKGFGTGGNYGSSIKKHDDNEKGHAINNAKKFSTEQKGSTVHYYAHTADGQKHHLGYSEHRFTHSGFTSFGLPTHSK